MIFNNSIGIKQTIRYEWMNYTVDLIKSGLNNDEIKKELFTYLSERKGNGKIGDRAEKTMSLAVTILMNIWIAPKNGLTNFRDKLLNVMNQNNRLICHWAMISSAYPFWFNMSYTIGSLFKHQDRVKKSQIMSRTYEILGERNTVERCSRYVIRSFISWNLIKDDGKAGFYKKNKILDVSDIQLVCILIEALLNAIPEERIPLNTILNCPAFFNFSIPLINGANISKENQNISIERFSVNEEYVSLKNKIYKG